MVWVQGPRLSAKEEDGGWRKRAQRKKMVHVRKREG